MHLTHRCAPTAKTHLPCDHALHHSQASVEMQYETVRSVDGNETYETTAFIMFVADTRRQAHTA
jgi:hypothetical protein